MDDQKKQLLDRLNQAQNILVTVSSNPSVDQLSAAIGLTLVLNHLDKHATAVFSGEVPSTLEFLKPEETLEKNTDSLRDFIIALDKSKADKLRYKVEDQVVRIFITPYKTSITDKDLDFSQGDFNVDVVVALGVREQQDLDSAITAHGRILHDATVASLSLEAGNNLGSINLVDTSASSLCELVLGLSDALDKKVVDSQIATALLTGIVSATERFRNDKTTPKAMSASAELMAAGANQQLIATELEAAVVVDHDQNDESNDSSYNDSDNQDEPEPQQSAPKKEPGTLEIEHEGEKEEPESNPEFKVEETPEEPPHPQVHVDEDGHFTTLDADQKVPEISTVRGVSADGEPTTTEADKSEVNHDRLTGPARQTGNLTANTVPENYDAPTEELSLPPLETPMLSHDGSVLSPAVAEPTVPVMQPAPQNWQPPEPPSAAPTETASAINPTPPVITPDETLAEIEKSVDSPHLQPEEPKDAETTEPTASVDSARSAVEAAFSRPDAPSDPLQPIAALNAQPLGEELRSAAPAPYPPPVTNAGFSEPTPGNTPADQTLDMPVPQNAFPAPQGSAEQFQNPQQFPASSFPGTPPVDPNAPGQGSNGAPPVPPPFVPPFPQ